MSDPFTDAAETVALPVRAEWFEFREVGQGITHITEPGVHPFLRSNLWYLEGAERPLLVDAGLGVGDLPAALTERGLQQPLIWVTHAHLDHMGGAHGFAEVWSHPAEAPALRAPEPDTIVTRLLPAPFQEALASGVPDGVVPDYLIDSVPSPAFRPENHRGLPCPPTRELGDGDRIDLGDRVVEVVHLPGHTPGSAALFDRDTGTLFSGDVVYDDELLDELPESDIGDYVASMRRLMTLPVRTVHAGHEPSFDGERLLVLCEQYLAYRG
jgi:glyoxylase-like metal-dependent hydrolase (beta-lactamase superfamily II)